MSSIVTIFRSRFSLKNQGLQRLAGGKKRWPSNFFTPTDIFSCEPSKNGVLLLRHLKTFLFTPHLRPSFYDDPQTGPSKNPLNDPSKKRTQTNQSQKHMKPKIIQSILAAALLAPGALFAQTTATTTPVGYVSLGNNGSVPADTDVTISIPLLKSAVYTGTVSSVTGSDVDISGTPNFASLTSVPHVMVVENNTKSGVVGLITANDTNTLTVSLQAGQSLTGLTAGDKVSVRPAWTVLNFLGNQLPVGTQLQAWSGTGQGIVLAPDLIFEWDGTNWVDTNSFEPADNTVLFPGEGFFLRSLSAISNLVVSGEVPLAKHNIALVGNATPDIGQDNVISYFSPVGEIIGNSGAGFTAGDQILYYNNAASGTVKAPNVLEYDGTDWVDTDSFEPVTTTFLLQPGQAYVYRRATAAPATFQAWIDQQTYVTP